MSRKERVSGTNHRFAIEVEENRKHSCSTEEVDSVTVGENVFRPLGFRHAAPFSTDPEAAQTLAECDYNEKITLEMASSGKSPRRIRVYADGVYDMFHSGHARQLMQACTAFPNTYLIVGVTSDADTLAKKGKTVMNERERYEAIRHCRYVDEVLAAAPWECTVDFLKSHKIDFIAHDDIPYETEGCSDAYQPFKEAGMFLTTQRAEGISTTDVIGRILRDYDDYLRRNISRGLSRHDLNISYVKEKQLRIENNLQTIVEKGNSLLTDFGTKRRRIVESLENIYQDVSTSFMGFFGTHVRLQNWWLGATLAIKKAVSLTDSPESSSRSSTSSEKAGKPKEGFDIDDGISTISGQPECQPVIKRRRANSLRSSEKY